jgi:hypothetical protein
VTLELALELALADVAVMERNGGQFAPLAVARLVHDIAQAAQPFTTWLSESDAMLRAGRGTEYFRSRFGAWEAQGMAEKRRGIRYYRACIVPVREAQAA